MHRKETASFSAVLESSTNKLWGSHVAVPARAATAMIDGASRRVWCSIDDGDPFQCALIPHGNGRFVITINKTRREAAGLNVGDSVRIALRRDDSDYGLPLPGEFAELLRQDAEGDRLFHALTAGKQRTLLYIIGNGRTPDERIRRALAVVEHVKSNKGKIDYRKLNAALKRR